MNKVSDIAAQITAASREQSTGIEQVNRAVMQMDTVTQQNASLVQEAAAALRSIAEQARALNEAIAQYRTDADGANLQSPAAGRSKRSGTRRREIAA